MRVVIDTNTFISATLCPSSLPQKAVEYCLSQGLVFFSESTFQELSSRITRSKFDKYISLQKREAFVESIYQARTVFFCIPQETITDSKDADDNQFLEVAVETNADYLITGDKKHLLPLNPYRGIQIVTPREFLCMKGVIGMM